MAKKRVKIPSRPNRGGKKNSQKDMLKQLSQMQEQIMQAQEELEESEFTGTSGGGAVTAVIKGSHEISSIKIDPDVIDEDDIEMLEDLIVAAVNDAQKKVSEASSNQTSSFAGGLPGGLDLNGLNIPGL